MPRYIDADVLYKNILEEQKGHAGSVRSIVYGSIAVMVRESPTADVAEVRHGTWIEDGASKDEYGELFYNYHCSLCEKKYARYDDGREPYCPNCGSKMDGEPK